MKPFDRDSIKRETPFEFKETKVVSRGSRFGRPRIRVQTVPTDDGRTEQQHAADADVRVLFKRYIDQGIPLPQRPTLGQYLDLTDVPAYQEALNKIVQANEMFAALPAEIRDRYQNDPQRFLAALRTQEGVDLLIKHKLATPPSPASPASPDANASAGQAEAAQGATTKVGA